MSSITTTTDRDQNLTQYTVEGRLAIEELAIHIREHNASELPNVLWDFRNGEVPPLTTAEADEVVQKVNQYVVPVEGRRVALVTRKQLDFGLLRIWNALSEIASGIEHRVFYEYQDALDWFGLSSDTS